MKRFFVFLMGLVVASGAMFGVLTTAPVYAQEDFDMQLYQQSLDELDKYLDSSYSNWDEAAAATAAGVTGIFGGLIVLYICAGIVGLVNLIFLIISLIHCVQNAPDDQKTLWILLIIFVPFVGIIYFFTKRKEWVNGQVVAKVAPAAAPAATPVEKK